MTIPKLTPYTGPVANPDGSQTQAEFTQNMFGQLSYEAQLATELDATIDGMNQAVTDVENNAAAASASAASAEASASTAGYKGLWPDTGGSANKGDTYQTQVGGTPTGEYYTALQNTTVDPVVDNVNWKVNIGTNNITNPNLISNSSFDAAGSVAIPPDATPRSYNAGDELFSGIFAAGNLSNVTYVDGKLNGTGQLYVDVYKTEKQKLSTSSYAASVASSDGNPVESGASFVDSGDYWRITFDMNDTFSVKFEQGSVPTRHEVAINADIKSFAINITDHGYIGDYLLSDGSVNPTPTDNRQAWLNAISSAKEGDMIIVPYGMPGYVSTPETISIPKGVMVKQYSPQYCDNDTHDFSLWDYDGEGQQFGDFRFDIRPTNNATTWSNTGEIGLTIRNCQDIDCDIKSLWGFYTGLLLIGENDKGVAHCTFNLGLMFDNKIDIKIYGTGTEGYVNQNTFNQGQFITSSTLNQATGKYAVVIDHEGTYKHNSNVFYNPSFEKKSDANQDNVAILIRAGRNNNFFNARAEMKNGKAVMRVEGTSERNVATVLFSNGVNGLVNAGTGSNNVVSNVYDQPYDFEVFNIGDFSQLIRAPKAGETTSFGLDMWRSVAGTPSYWDGGSNFDIEGKLSVLNSGNAVGKLVNTFEAKKLTAFASFSEGTTGRIICIPFDENMTPITDLSEFKTINSQAIASEGAAFTGGAFTFGVNISGGGYVVEVTEDCKYLWVGAYAKGSAAKCNQLSVSTVKAAGSGLIAISPGYSSNGIPTTLDLPLGSFFHRINRTQLQSRGWSFDGSVWFED